MTDLWFEQTEANEKEEREKEQSALKARSFMA